MVEKKHDINVPVFLKSFFDRFKELDIKVWEDFEKLGETITLAKDTIVKEANSKENYLSLIVKGSGGNFIWRDNSFVCIDFGFENEFLVDYMSFTLQAPTPIEVKTFEETIIFRISYRVFKDLLETGVFGEKITRIIAEFAFIEKQQQQVDLLTKTAKTRYLELIETRPSAREIPLKYIASYLGVTPQSLSRIRASKV